MASKRKYKASLENIKYLLLINRKFGRDILAYSCVVLVVRAEEKTVMERFL